MSLRYVLKVSAGIFFCSGIVFGDAVSLVGGYVGSYMDPGPGYSVSSSWPASSGYNDSELVFTSHYSVTESASGNLTAASLQVSNSYTGGYVNDTKVASINSFSGATLLVEGPVYLAESVTLNYSYLSTAHGSPYVTEYLEFVDSTGNDLSGGCTVTTTSSAGTQSCSTGLLFVSGNAVISINNSLGASVVINSAGDAATFQGTATLGSLEIYDSNKNLIDTVDLASLTLTPEPSCVFLMATGLFGFVVLKRGRSNARLKS